MEIINRNVSNFVTGNNAGVLFISCSFKAISDYVNLPAKSPDVTLSSVFLSRYVKGKSGQDRQLTLKT